MITSTDDRALANEAEDQPKENGAENVARKEDDIPEEEEDELLASEDENNNVRTGAKDQLVDPTQQTPDTLTKDANAREKILGLGSKSTPHYTTYEGYSNLMDHFSTFITTHNPTHQINPLTKV
jgi:hypothetical protein